MSKICLITAQNVQMSPDSLRRRIVDLLAERNIGAFFPTASNVGLTEYEDAFVCSISDDFLYDNCERLLLPDDCWYNGTCSSAPFAERMNSVCDIVRYAADCSGEVELFIGDCGQCPLTEKALFPKQYDALSHELPDVSDEISKSQTRRRTEMSSGGSLYKMVFQIALPALKPSRIFLYPFLVLLASPTTTTLQSQPSSSALSGLLLRTPMALTSISMCLNSTGSPYSSA